MKDLKTNIAFLLSQIQLFEEKLKNFNFNGEENKEDVLDEINSAIIALDEIEEILDRDKELTIMKEAVSHENN